MTEENYSKLSQHLIPEIERVPIHEIVIEMINAHLDPVTVIKGVDPIKVRTSIGVLNELNMIKEEGGIREILPAGRFAPEVPLSVYNSAFLYRWMEQKLPAYPGVVVASLIDVYGPGYFYIPRKEQGESDPDYSSRIFQHMKKYVEPFMGYSPIETYLNLYNSLAQKLDMHLPTVVAKGAFDRNIYPLYADWQKETSANGKKIKELFLILKQVYNSVLRYFIKRDNRGKREEVVIPDSFRIGLFTPINVIKAALPILVDVYKSKIMTKTYGTRFRDASGTMYNLNNRQVVSKMDFETQTPSHIVALSVAQIGTRNIISLAIPVKAEGEDEAGKEVGKAGKEEDVTEGLNKETIADIFS